MHPVCNDSHVGGTALIPLHVHVHYHVIFECVHVGSCTMVRGQIKGSRCANILHMALSHNAISHVCTKLSIFKISTYLDNL